LHQGASARTDRNAGREVLTLPEKRPTVRSSVNRLSGAVAESRLDMDALARL
jgi:hypothetical protein